MIRYHGGPITPNAVAVRLWTGRHALVSFARQDQLELAAEVSHSFVLDNGAFSVWRNGGELDVRGFSTWVSEWRRHPGFSWAIVPDVIEGTEAENDDLLDSWEHPHSESVPVWHLHESFGRLERLVGAWPRVAFGSSGQYATPGNEAWWGRMASALRVACDSDGRPRARLHGLRMMDPLIFSHIPFASVDSSGIARNIGMDVKWNRGYLRGLSKTCRAQVLADRFDNHATATVWKGRACTESMFLLG